MQRQGCPSEELWCTSSTVRIDEATAKSANTEMQRMVKQWQGHNAAWFLWFEPQQEKIASLKTMHQEMANEGAHCHLFTSQFEKA